MRKDMASVIIDRPRYGGDGGKSIPGKGYKKALAKAGDDAPRTESMTRPYKGSEKSLNEHLSPLRRWLQKQVGRNWDKVWSEICDGLSVRNATTAHVRDHADKYVEKNCTIIGKIVCDSAGVPLTHPDFYVDPKTKQLRMLTKKQSNENFRIKKHGWNRNGGLNVHEPRVWVPKEGDFTHQFHLIDGVWYEVILASLPIYKIPAKHENSQYMKNYFIAGSTECTTTGITDVLFRDHHPTVGDCNDRYGRKVYAKSKRQMGKKEIARLKLWETAPGKRFLEQR